MQGSGQRAASASRSATVAAVAAAVAGAGAGRRRGLRRPHRPLPQDQQTVIVKLDQQQVYAELQLQPDQAALLEQLRAQQQEQQTKDQQHEHQTQEQLPPPQQQAHAWVLSPAARAQHTWPQEDQLQQVGRAHHDSSGCSNAGDSASVTGNTSSSSSSSTSGSSTSGSSSSSGLDASMLPGPLTAAFARLLKQPASSSFAAPNNSSSDSTRHAQAQDPQQQQQQADPCVQELLAHAQALAPQLLPRQASLVLYACAKLRLRQPPGLQDALLQRLAPHTLALLPPAGLANTLWALAVLGVHPNEEWMAALYDAAAGAHAPCTLTYTAGGGTGHSGSTSTNSTAAAGPGGGSNAFSVGSSTNSSSGGGGAGPAGLAAFNPPQLVQLLWALGRLRQRPPPAWLQALLALLQPRLPSLAPSELTNTLWGLAQLGYRPGAGWVGAWLRASRDSMDRAGPDCLACQVACLGLLRLELRSGAWLVAMRGAVAAALPSMGPRHVAAIMCGLAKRRAPQPPHWVEALLCAQLRWAGGPHAGTPALGSGGVSGRSGQNAARQQQQQQQQLAAAAPLQPRDVAATVWALPLLLYPTAVEWAAHKAHAAALQQLAAASLPLLPRCSAPELLQLAVGFARLGFYPGAHWLKMHEAAVAAHRLPLTDPSRARLRAAVRQLWSDG